VDKLMGVRMANGYEREAWVKAMHPLELGFALFPNNATSRQPTQLQSLTVPSTADEASSRPSPEKSTNLTSPVCPSSDRAFDPVAVCQISTVSLEFAVASHCE
jgi:hypothetical protein